jgi:Spy/CpxP family protein refolding chaperone
MNKHKLIPAGLAFLALLLAAPAFSRPPSDGPRGDRQPRIERLVNALNLDAAQTTKLKALHEDHRDAVSSLREQMKSRRAAMKALWLAPNLDRGKIVAAHQELDALEGQIGQARLDFMFGARAILRPDQFQRFLELKERRGRHHRGPAPGPECDGEDCDRDD